MNPSLFPRGDHSIIAKSDLKRVSEENFSIIAKRARRSVSKITGEGHLYEKSDSEMCHCNGPVSISNFTTGCLVLGFILQIIKSDVLVSLPGGFTGVVAYQEISDVIHKLVTDGRNPLPASDTLLEPFQIVRCFVLGQFDRKDSQKKIIALSMRSSLINKGIAMKHFGPGFPISGCISSKEDHGWVVSIGIAGMNCFLPSKHSQNKSLLIGQPIECVCSAVNEISRSLTLRSHTKVVSQAITVASLTFSSLNPGMLFSVIVDAIYKGGLVVTFLGLFKGYIDNSSLDLDKKSLITVGDVLSARMIFLDIANKVARLSLKKHIVGMQPPSNLPALGSVLSKLEVASVNTMGIILKREVLLNGQTATNEIIAIPVFIHKTSLARIESLATSKEVCSTYKSGMKINSVRVKGYNLVEGWIVGSNMEEYMHESVVHVSDVKVGQILDVVIFGVKDFGLVVKIGLQGVSAVCPILHSADVVVETKLSKKFKVGQICKMRVWEVSGSSIIMTNKKSIVNAESKFVLQSADDVEVGKTVVGVVSKISDRDGITVHFFNRMKGIILASVLVKQEIYHFSTAFRVGQVITTVIIKVEVKNETPIIYLGLDLNISTDAIVSLTENVNFRTGAIIKSVNRKYSTTTHEFVDGVVSAFDNDCIFISLDDGRMAKTTKYHFFDFAETADRVFSSTDNEIVVGYKVKGALILSSVNGLFITCKPLLLNIVGCTNQIMPNKVADLSPGQIVVGFISKVENYGVLVRFRDNLTALAPRPNISDKFVSSPIGRFFVGDSVRCVVQRVDLTKERIIVTFKTSIVLPSAGNVEFLSSYFSENFISREKFRQTIKLGTVVSAVISSIEEFGVVLTSDKSTLIVVKDMKANGDKLQIGRSMNVLIVDVDYEHSVYEGILDLYEVKKLNILQDSVVDGTIILVKDKYLVVVSDGLFGYVKVGDYHNPKPDISDYKVGASLKMKFIHPALSTRIQYPQEGIPLFSLIPNDSSSGKKIYEHVSETDSSIPIVETLTVGSLHRWTISSVNLLETVLQPNFSYLPNMTILAKLHISNSIDILTGVDDLEEVLNCPQVSSLNNVNHPFHNFKVGSDIWCYVQKFVIKKNESNEVMVTLSLASRGDSGFLPFRNMFALPPRDVSLKFAVGVVTKIGDTSCCVSVSPNLSAMLNYMDVSRKCELNVKFKHNCFIGLRVVVKVSFYSKDKLNLRASRGEIEEFLSRDLNFDEDEKVNKILRTVHENDIPVTAGQIVTGFLNLKTTKLPNPPAIMVCLRGMRFGRVCITEICDREDWCDLTALFDHGNSSHKKLPNGLSHGDLVRCVVLSVNEQFLELSLRHTRMVANSSDSCSQDTIGDEGSLVKGFVVHTSSRGCFLRLSQFLTGQVLMKDLSDEFITDPQSQFPPGMLVSARLLFLNQMKGQARLSLKLTSCKNSVPNSLPVIGDMVSGTVTQVTDFGVFVKLSDVLVGLARASTFNHDWNNLAEKFKVGDVVNAVILNVSHGKISLSLNQQNLSQQHNKIDAFVEVEEMDLDLKSSCVATSKTFYQVTKKSAFGDGECLNANSDLLWDDFILDQNNGLCDQSEADSQFEITRIDRQKDNKLKNVEHIIRTIESTASDNRNLPANADDFERLLITDPNSSLIWTRYMAFYLNTSDVEASRSVAERALRTINFREEEEKFNVWMSLINLEHKFGTMESLQAVFNRAAQESKEKRIFLEVAELYQREGDTDGTENIFKKALKRSQLKKSKKIWTAYLQFKLRFDCQNAKEQLNRSLQCLSKHKHVEVITKYALSEFDYGSADRGRALFEELLSSYPKRSDLWHLYVDKEVKLGNVNQARQVFERMINIKTSNRNLKLIFKKYLGFELKYGDEYCQEQVKQKARNYVNKLVC